MVKVEVAPIPTLVGLKFFVIVGGAITVNVAVFDVVPAPPLVELTAPVVLFLVPAEVPVTFTTRVQLELTARVPPVKLMLPAPCVEVKVPPQVLLAPFGVATTSPLGKVSLTARPVCV